MKFYALAALATVSTNAHQIDLFNPVNFLRAGGNNLVKKMLHQTSHSHKISLADDPLGKVTFTQCDDDMGVFTLDTDATKSDPDPMVKGSSVGLDLHGIVSDTI